MSKGRSRFLFILVMLIALLVVASPFLERAPVIGKPINEFRTGMEVMALLKTSYVDPVKMADLARAYWQKRSISGMLDSLKDPYTRYMDKKSFKDLQAETQGTFGGIGIIVGMKDEYLTIVSPIDGTPGYRAGLKPNDRIIRIDSRKTKGMSSQQAVELMRGPKNTKVLLTIERETKNDSKRFNVNIIRDEIKLESTKAEVLKEDPEIGYVRISSFSETTASDLHYELTSLGKKQVKGLIMDLRYNPGGLLTAAVDVCGEFLEQGKPIVHVVGRTHPKATYGARTSDGHWGSYPLVILINEGTASASEIVTGALQDYGIATVVGTQSFGKGLVQSIIPLSNGSGVAITTDRYLTAKGRSIHKIGITPDVVVKLPELPTGKRAKNYVFKDTQLETAIEIIKGKISKNHSRTAA